MKNSTVEAASSRFSSGGDTSPGKRLEAASTEEGARRGAVVVAAACTCILIALLALAAPLLASGRPFVLFVPSGEGGRGFGALPEGWTFPWFHSLFDRRLYESFLDRAANALLVLSPLLLLAASRRTLRRLPFLAVSIVALAGVMGATIDTSGPARDYREKVESMRARSVDVVAVFPPIARSPSEPDYETGLSGPTSGHPLGTDVLGRDVAARLLFGARSALAVGLIAVILANLIGILVGALAGFRGGVTDLLVGRAIEVAGCIPFFVLVVTLIAVLGRHSLWHIVLIFGLVGWDGPARLVRAEFLKLREIDSTLAARALGVPGWRIALVHLLPAAMTPLVVSAGFAVASTILVEASLAFLGLSDPTLPSWGQVLRAGRDTRALHLILAPGILIFCLVTAINLLADAVRVALDPKQSGRQIPA